MAPNAAEPPRTPAPAADGPRLNEVETHLHEDGRGNDPAAVPYPIEPAFRRLAESLSDLVWSARPDGYSDYYNRRFLDYLGRTLDQMQGWTWAEMLHPDDAEAARRAWERAASTGGEYEVEFRLRRHDGQYRWFRSRGYPMLDDDGRIIRWFGTCTDFEERKRAEGRLRESEAALRAFFDNSPALAGVVEPTGDGDILHVYDSPTTCRFFGAEPGTTAGRRASELGAPPEVISHWLAAYRRSEEGGDPVRFEYEHRSPSGGRWLSVTVSPIGPGPAGRSRFCYVAEDITGRRRAEERLRVGEERLRLAVEKVGMAWWDMDLRGGPLLWSPTHFTLLGYEPSPDGVASFDLWSDRLHPDDRERVVGAFEEARLNGTPYSQVYRIIRADDGRVRWITAYGCCIHDDRGQVARSLGILFDDTERKKAEESVKRSELRWRTMAETLPNLVWTDLPDGQCDWLGSQWGKYTGSPEEELLGLGWLETVIHPDDQERTLACWQAACEDRGDYDLEYRIRRYDGEYRWFKTRGVPVRDEGGTIVYWFGTCTDIEDVKRMEAALREADRRKDEFLATLAHELRNPLAPLRNALQIMRMASGDPQAIDQARTLMERQVTHMVRLIDDLMDVSRITRGKMELRKERVELAAVVRAAVETSRPLVDASGHELAITLPDRPILVDADPTRLAQVLSNLLNNAAKYTEPGGEIVLVVERLDGDVLVTVRDNGVGIPPEMLPRIFEMFTQVDRTLERSQGGLGIGLTLVRRLIEMHGGSVEARSEGHGRGSEFVVRLPIVQSVVHEERTAGEERQASSAIRYSILVVDDNEDAAGSLAMMLNIMGNEVRTAHDGLECLRVTEAFRPDVILLDIGMPRLNGFDACRGIREQPWGRGIYIVALTGWGQEDDKRRSKEAGFDAHLVKPVEPAALEELMESVALRRAE